MIGIPLSLEGSRLFLRLVLGVGVNKRKSKTRINNIINLLFVDIGSFFCSLILSRYVFSHASIVSCDHCLRPGFTQNL